VKQRVAGRTEDIEAIAGVFPRRLARLVRLLYRESKSTLPRGMASILGGIEAEPLRITALAEREGLSQPSVTRMVERLEALGLARRDRGAEDRRVVSVTITDRGRKELLELRARYEDVLRQALRDRPPEDIRRLREASEALEWLIDVLRPRP
jgi:DNA-binding MarR family transcriptional regulator